MSCHGMPLWWVDVRGRRRGSRQGSMVPLDSLDTLCFWCPPVKCVPLNVESGDRRFATFSDVEAKDRPPTSGMVQTSGVVSTFFPYLPKTTLLFSDSQNLKSKSSLTCCTIPDVYGKISHLGVVTMWNVSISRF